MKLRKTLQEAGNNMTLAFKLEFIGEFDIRRTSMVLVGDGVLDVPFPMSHSGLSGTPAPTDSVFVLPLNSNLSIYLHNIFSVNYYLDSF